MVTKTDEAAPAGANDPAGPALTYDRIREFRAEIMAEWLALPVLPGETRAAWPEPGSLLATCSFALDQSLDAATRARAWELIARAIGARAKSSSKVDGGTP